jgi:three-Cys-motif partner protein
MSKEMDTVWEIKPHTEVKHKILKAYFGAWFSIVGQRFQKLIFVDGFCGPGVYSKGEPGSPVIVLEEAHRALSTGRVNWRTDLTLDLRFIDEDKDRIDNLNLILAKTQNGDRRIALQAPVVGTFEESIKPLLTSLETARPACCCPLLVFIDPFGAKGFSMATISRILKLDGAEIFMLFDADGIDRILGAWNEPNCKILGNLFGIDVQKLEPIRHIADRGGRIVELRKAFYASLETNGVQGILPFRLYVADGNPLFDLVFLTNKPLGFIKMKEAMWKADGSGDFHFVETAVDQLEIQLESHEKRVWDLLMGKFAGRRIFGAEVQNFVDLQTLYLKKHKTSALKLHESAQVEEVQRIKVERKNSRGPKGYTDADFITFPSLSVP